MKTKFVRVYLNFEYIVPESAALVDYAKKALIEDVDSAIKYDELDSYLKVEPLTEANSSDVPDFIYDYQNEFLKGG